MEKKGIDNIKEVLALLDKALDIVYEAKTDDGKIDLKDLPKLTELIPYVGPAIGGVTDIGEEFKDIDVEEAKELIALIVPMASKIFTLIGLK